ncbi:hypothetical protein Tco_0531593 [Tanacetum coccineum]
MDTIRLQWGSNSSWGECWIAKSRITCDNTNRNTKLSEAHGVSLRITSGVRVMKYAGTWKALVERENMGLDLTKSDLCPSFVKDHPAKGVGLCVADSHTGNHREDSFTPLETIRRFLGKFKSRSLSSLKGRPSSWKGGLCAIFDHLKGKVIVLSLFVMNAKYTIRIQTCELTKEELADFLEDYPIPPEYKVMLPKRNQTIFDASDSLNPFGCAKLTTFIVMCKAYGYEPLVELFRDFFNLFPGGKWLTFAKRLEKHIPNLMSKVIIRIEGWKGRFFFVQDFIFSADYPQLLSKDNRWDTKSFKDKLPPQIEQNPMIQSLEMEFRNFMYAKTDKDLSFLPKEPSPDFGTALLKHKLVQGSSSTHATHAKTASSKDNSLFLTISNNDEGLHGVLELQDANACHLKISAITPSAWKGHLDNHLDLELLDLHDHCYVRQVVVDNVVNRRARELIKVVEQMKGECDVLKEREKAKDQECEDLKVKCETTMIGFDKNMAMIVLREKISSLLGDIKEHKVNLDRILLESQKWARYHVSLSTLELKVASLEAEKVRLEAAEASLRQELENAKLDKAEVVLKVVPYMATELVQSNDIGKLVAKLVSSASIYGRCQAFEEVAIMKEPFDITKVKGYRPSYKRQRTKAGNEFATATFPYLADVVADPYTFVETLLFKKLRVLQRPVLSRTYVPASSAPS